MNCKIASFILKYIHKNKPTNSEVIEMDEFEKLLREIMEEYDCGPLYALWILSNILEIA